MTCTGHAANVEMPLCFQGQYCDAETGLHYNRFRYYDPQVGRFTTQDPISFAGGFNLYQYAPNSINWVDPLGLHPLDNTELGKKLISNSSRTGKNFQGQQIYEIDNKVTIDGVKFKKGDYYFDGLHKDHVEAFSSNNESKGVFNSDD